MEEWQNVSEQNEMLLTVAENKRGWMINWQAKELMKEGIKETKNLAWSGAKCKKFKKKANQEEINKTGLRKVANGNFGSDEAGK